MELWVHVARHVICGVSPFGLGLGNLGGLLLGISLSRMCTWQDCNLYLKECKLSVLTVKYSFTFSYSVYYRSLAWCLPVWLTRTTTRVYPAGRSVGMTTLCRPTYYILYKPDSKISIDTPEYIPAHSSLGNMFPPHYKLYHKNSLSVIS